MILPYQTIKKLALEKGMISPFVEKGTFGGVTHGCSSCSYDLRLADDIVLWPGKSINVDAMERLLMPADIMGRLYAKSTWAREHIEPFGTLIDPGFSGVLRLELSMHYGDNPVVIRAGTGIVQIVFERLEEPTELLYQGKYQNQRPGQNAIFDLVEDRIR